MVYLYTWCIYISIHHVIYIYVCWLVVLTILTNMKVNGQDHPIYYGKLKNVPNHQPVCIYHGISLYIMVYLYTSWYISIHGVSISLYTMLYIYMLVGGFNHLDKYESQWAGSSHILWKIKKMFQTTNQYVYIMVYLYTLWYISIHHGISLYMVYLYLYTPCYIYICWLVVLIILTNMKVNGQDHPIYYGKLKKCSKPPTSMSISWYISIHHGISLYIMVYLYTWCIYISIHHVIYICWLVVLTILTNMKVNGQDHPIYYGKLKKCSKPPTSMYISWYISIHHGISLYIMVYLYTWCIYISIHHVIYICWLVVLTILTNMKVNGQDHPIYYGKLKKCSKPPTSMYISWYISIHHGISLYIMVYLYTWCIYISIHHVIYIYAGWWF